MPTLSYDISVVGLPSVDRALSGIEKRLVDHNRRAVGMTVRTPGASSFRSPSAARMTGRAQVDRDARSAARGFDQIGRAARAADARTYRDRERLESNAQRQSIRGFEQIGRAARAADAQTYRERLRQEARAARSADATRREFRQRTGAVVGAGIRSVGGIGAAALGAVGLASGALIASKIGPAMSLEQRQRQVIVNARGAGEANPIGYGDLQGQIRDTAIATGASQESVTGGLETYTARTGDLKTGISNMKTFATVAMATGASVEDLAGTAADLAQKFKISDPREMADALAVLAYQGKKGAFELRDMANTFPEMAAAAERLGMSGLGGMKLLGGLAQIARKSTGSGAEASTALQMAMTQVVAKGADLESGAALGGKSVKVFTDKSKTHTKDFRGLLADIITTSGGNLPQLGKLFDVRGIRAMSPLITAYTAASEQAGGGKKGATAGRNAVLKELDDASNASGSFADVQRDASDTMKSATTQMEILNTQLTAIVQKDLLPSLVALIPHVQKLTPYFSKLVEAIAKAVDTFAKNPIGNIGEIIATKVAYDIAAAAIGPRIVDALTKAISGTGTGTGGSGSGGAPGGFFGSGESVGSKILGNALAALTITTLSVQTFKAGTLLIDHWLKTNKDDVETSVKRFNEERGALNNTGDVETLADIKTLTAQKAELEAEQKKPLDSKNPLLNAAQALGAKPLHGYGDSVGEALYAEKKARDAEFQKTIDRLSKEINNLSTAIPKGEPNRGNSPSPVK